MAQDTVVSCPSGVWTELTDTDTAGDISVAVVSGVGVLVRATTGATEPTGTDGFPLPSYGDGWSEATIGEKFTGVANADRLWARPINDGTTAQVRISHA